jgi:predicted transcriptional regulator
MSQVVEEGRRPVHLGVMVRAEQRRELRERAEQEDRSVSALARAAIDAYLERERERRDA